MVTSATSLIHSLVQRSPDEFQGCVQVAVGRLSRVCTDYNTRTLKTSTPENQGLVIDHSINSSWKEKWLAMKLTLKNLCHYGNNLKMGCETFLNISLVQLMSRPMW